MNLRTKLPDSGIKKYSEFEPSGTECQQTQTQIKDIHLKIPYKLLFQIKKYVYNTMSEASNLSDSETFNKHDANFNMDDYRHEIDSDDSFTELSESNINVSTLYNIVLLHMRIYYTKSYCIIYCRQRKII